MKTTIKFPMYVTGIVLLILNSCATVYHTPDAFVLAHAHTNIAIIPPKVSIAAKKKVDAESIKENQKTQSINFQKEMYSWMLKRKMQGKIHTEIQDVETTNAKLNKANYLDNTLSPAEMCALLGVDGIITSNYALSKPISDGGAVALVLLTGTYVSSNEVTVSMAIHDTKSKKMIWNYDYATSGASTSELVDALMRNASKKMPYVK